MHFQRPLYVPLPPNHQSTVVSPFRICPDTNVDIQRILLQRDKIVHPQTLDRTRSIHFFYIDEGKGRTWFGMGGYMDWNKGDILIFSSEVEVLYHEGGRAVLLYCPQGAMNMKFSPLFYPYRLLSAKANEIFRQLERKEFLLTNYWMREHFCTTPLFSLFFVEIPPTLRQPCRQTVFETFIFGKGQEFVYTVMGLDEGDVDRRTRCIIQKWTTEFRIPLGWWYRHVNESNHPTRFVILEIH
jgi:hypothetical protein